MSTDYLFLTQTNTHYLHTAAAESKVSQGGDGEKSCEARGGEARRLS